MKDNDQLIAKGYKRCGTCDRRKRTADFRLLSKTPHIYSADCLICLHTKGVPDTPADRHRAAMTLGAEAAYSRELASRELCRRRLLPFIQRYEPNYLAGWAHRDICHRLERFMRAVERKEEPRLMLFLPPRFGKSLIASNYFPSWVLGHHPEWEIIASSYAAGLPMGFSRKIRARLREMNYRAMFKGTVLDPESQSVEAWLTTKGGGYVAAGVGGGITGKGAHILLIDDPIKDAEEADSEVVREAAWDWVGSTAYTRLAPGGGMILILTRWHDADPAGKFLDAEAELKRAGVPPSELENWEVVSYPAIAIEDEYLAESGQIIYHPAEKARPLRKKGEALHPERFPLASLLKKKRTLQPRHWSALYQQTPIPEGGEFIKKEHVRHYQLPHDFSGTGYVHMLVGDLAISEKQTGNYTVLGVTSMDWNGDLYVREVIRARMGTFDIVMAIVALWKRYNCNVCGIEQGQIWQAIWPVLERYLKAEHVYMNFNEELKPITDKIARARPLQGMSQQGRVLYPQGAAWLEVCIAELLRFPGGVTDDFVDMMAWTARLAALVPLPRPPVRPKKAKSWRDKLKGMGREERHFMAA